MRVALGEPLHHIPESILNKVVSKSIQADLKKYKMGKRGSAVNQRERTRSPTARVRREEEIGEETLEQSQWADLSQEVSHLMS
jgi:hypothetical protein